MCDVLIPALIGVAALGLLGGGGGVGAGCDNCPTGPVCAVEQVGNKTITYPQLAGEGTNVVHVSAQSQDYGYAAPQQAAPYYPAPQANYQAGPSHYAPAPNAMAHPGHYGDPYQSNVGGSINYDGQSALGAGAYSNPYGSGVGANVGGLDAGVGVGNGGIGANVGDVGIGLGAQSY